MEFSLFKNILIYARTPIAVIGALSVTIVTFLFGIFINQLFQTMLGFVPFVAVVIIEISALLWVLVGRKKRSNKITWPQVQTMLRLHKGKITASQIASATGFQEAEASRFLKKLVLEHVLTVAANESELVYSALDFSELG